MEVWTWRSEGIPGKGSRFIISLPAECIPLEKRSATGPLKKPLQAVTSLQQRILVAEDNPSNRDTVVAFLEQAGYEVIIASDGVEAVEQAREAHPDLVIMDIQMPLLDGLEAIRPYSSGASAGESSDHRFDGTCDAW